MDRRMIIRFEKWEAREAGGAAVRRLSSNSDEECFRNVKATMARLEVMFVDNETIYPHDGSPFRWQHRCRYGKQPLAGGGYSPVVLSERPAFVQSLHAIELTAITQSDNSISIRALNSFHEHVR